MKKNALISIISKQDDDESNKIEVVTPGNFYKKDDFYYAIYDETSITGMEDTTTTLKIGIDKFSLIRMGTTSTKMNFIEKYQDVILYNTPYGTMELQINTKKLNIDVNDEGGNVDVIYNLSVSGNKPLRTVLKINIKAELSN